jgi:hypothetical protein
LAQKRPDEARPIFERAVRIANKAKVDPVNLAKMRFGLARSLGGEPSRAWALALQARSALLHAEAGQPADVKEIDDWLAQRR